MNVYSNRNIIRKESTFTLDRKLLSIHTEDRDITKYPNNNEFSLNLHTGYKNIESIRLVNYNFPEKTNVFSSKYNNTKMNFDYVDICNNNLGTFEIVLNDGKYTNTQLAITIQNLMNEQIYNKTRENGWNPPIKPIKCKINEISNTFNIACQEGNVILRFDIENTFSGCKSIYSQNKNWGLGYYLGFEKQQYDSASNIFDRLTIGGNNNYGNNGLKFDYETTNWANIVPDISGQPSWALDPNFPITDNTKISYITSPNPIKIKKPVLYIELDKCNTLDEIYPYANTTNSQYNNNLCDNNDSAFAKIDLSDSNNNNNNGFTTNLSYFNPPINHLKQLHFKFRRHDGLLYDFSNQDYDFTIEINMLHDTRENKSKIYIPAVLDI